MLGLFDVHLSGCNDVVSLRVNYSLIKSWFSFIRALLASVQKVCLPRGFVISNMHVTN